MERMAASVSLGNDRWAKVRYYRPKWHGETRATMNSIFEIWPFGSKLKLIDMFRMPLQTQRARFWKGNEIDLPV